MEGRLLRLVAIGKYPTDHIDEKISWTPMATVFDLRDVFELVIDGFDDGPFARASTCPRA